MRAIYTSLCVAALLGVAACGPAKPADSPSNADEASPSSSGGANPTDSENAAPPSSPAPAPARGPSASGTPYDKEAVEIGLKRAAAQVKANCGAATDEDGKATGPWGKLTVTVTLGHNGHSRGATVPPPYDGKPVGKCIAQAFAILIYPPFAGADTTTDWTVEVVEPAPAKAEPTSKKK